MFTFLKKLFSPAPFSASAIDWTSFVLRIAFGGLMLVDIGLPKLNNFAKDAATFPDPLGVGNSNSMALTIFAEVACAGLLLLGGFTRFAAIILAFTMSVAAFVIHKNDPLDVKEHALLFLCAYLAIFLLGAGRFSLDGFLRNIRKM